MSVRETALAALVATLAAALDARELPPRVLRNETDAQRIPPGGLVIVRDGDVVSETVMFSPLAYAIEHGAEVEVMVEGATAEERAAALDDLLSAIAAAIAADRTLGGAVEFAAPGAPRFDDVAPEAGGAARAALVTVTLSFTATSTPLS